MLDALRDLLAPDGVDLIGSCGVEAWDARAPAHLASQSLFPGARGAIVVGSAGPTLFRRFRDAAERDASFARLEHPLDAFVGRVLDRGDALLASRGVRARRFEPTFLATPRIDFRTLGELAGLGAQGPFGLAIHPVHGPWWALRGAWLVDVEVPTPARIDSPCAGCARPCVGGDGATTIDRSTAEMRLRCPVGVASRYDADAIAYHHDRARPSWLRP